MEHHTYSLTIGISAHNESLNIQYVLQMLLSQTASFYHLEKIIVMCDGCTDDTEEKACEIAAKHPLIVVINDHRRVGKSERLNQIYRMNTSDILITIDADVTLGNSYVLDEVIRHFDNPDVALVSTNNLPIPGSNLTEKMLNVWDMYWYEVRKDINGGDTVHNIHGACLAVRKSVAQAVVYPKGIVANSQYIYFWIKSQGLKYYFAKEATLFYYSPNNVKDYLVQMGRYGGDKAQHAHDFGERFANGSHIPNKKKFSVLIRMMFRHPVLLPTVIIFQIWLLKFYKPRKPVQK